jgi:hypothetical protein
MSLETFNNLSWDLFNCSYHFFIVEKLFFAMFPFCQDDYHAMMTQNLKIYFRPGKELERSVKDTNFEKELWFPPCYSVPLFLFLPNSCISRARKTRTASRRVTSFQRERILASAWCRCYKAPARPTSEHCSCSGVRFYKVENLPANFQILQKKFPPKFLTTFLKTWNGTGI